MANCYTQQAQTLSVSLTHTSLCWRPVGSGRSPSPLFSLTLAAAVREGRVGRIRSCSFTRSPFLHGTATVALSIRDQRLFTIVKARLLLLPSRLSYIHVYAWSTASKCFHSFLLPSLLRMAFSPSLHRPFFVSLL